MNYVTATLSVVFLLLLLFSFLLLLLYFSFTFILIILYEHFLSASPRDELQALHNGNYIALFSVSDQNHCVLVVRNSEALHSAFYTTVALHDCSFTKRVFCCCFVFCFVFKISIEVIYVQRCFACYMVGTT